MRRFHSQKWWELKVEAYSKIMARLVDWQYCLGRCFDMFIEQKELPADVEDKLVAESRQAREYLTKAAAAGAYIVSSETADALEELMRSLDRRHPDVVSEIDTRYGAVRECIAKVRTYAERDMHKR